MNFNPLDIYVGDILVPDPLWNQTSRKPSQLPDRVEVLSVYYGRGCQTGVMFKVAMNDGKTRHLDAAWFTERVSSPILESTGTPGSSTQVAQDR